MGTNLIRAVLLASASAAAVGLFAPTAAYAQEQSYDVNIPAQSLGDALRALGRATKQNIVFDGSVVRGKRSVAVRGRLSAGEALQQMLSGSGLVMARGAGGALTVKAGNGQGGAELTSSRGGEGLGDKGVAEILVVGSRSQNMDIKRSEDDPQPYVVFDSADVERSGAANLQEFFRTRLSSNSNALAPGQSAFGSVAGSNARARLIAPAKFV